MAVIGFNSKYGYDDGPPPPGTGGPYLYLYGTPIIGTTAATLAQPILLQAQTFPLVPTAPNFNPFSASKPHYINPKHWCQMNLLICPEKPWQFTFTKANDSKFIHMSAPTCLTIREVLAYMAEKLSLPDVKKLVLYEVAEKGSGQWARGMRFFGDNNDHMKKPIKDYGWDQTRTGKPGEKPVVWLWIGKKG